MYVTCGRGGVDVEPDVKKIGPRRVSVESDTSTLILPNTALVMASYKRPVSYCHGYVIQEHFQGER